MLAIHIPIVFAAGFCVGYAARALRYYMRRTSHLMYSPHAGRSRVTTFGHARRAF